MAADGDTKRTMFEANRRAHQWLRLAALDDGDGITALRARFTAANYVWISAVLTSLTEGYLRSLGERADAEAVSAHHEAIELREHSPSREVDWPGVCELQVAIVDRLSAQQTPDVASRAWLYGTSAGISYRAGQ